MSESRQSRLRFVDAADIVAAPFELDGLPVCNAAGEKLGEVDGFVVDGQSGSPYYAVVDSGGWFKTVRYMVPIGHLTIDVESARALADVDRKTIESFPPFDFDRFDEVSDEALRSVEQQILVACGAAEIEQVQPAESIWNYENSTHYRQPQWWPSLATGKAC